MVKIFNKLFTSILLIAILGCEKKYKFPKSIIREKLNGYYILPNNKIKVLDSSLFKPDKQAFELKNSSNGSLEIIGFYNQNKPWPNAYMVLSLRNKKNYNFYVVSSTDIFGNDLLIQQTSVRTDLIPQDNRIKPFWHLVSNARRHIDNLKFKLIKLAPNQSIYFIYCFNIKNYLLGYTFKFRYIFNKEESARELFSNGSEITYSKILTGPFVTPEIDIGKLKNYLSSKKIGDIGDPYFKFENLQKITYKKKKKSPSGSNWKKFLSIFE